MKYYSIDKDDNQLRGDSTYNTQNWSYPLTILVYILGFNILKKEDIA